MFCAPWLLFLAVLAVSASINPTQTIQTAIDKRWNTVPNTTFITTHDGKFFVNGSVFNVVGTNAYWLSALNTDEDINNTLASIAKANFTVVRTWAFNDVDTIPENGTWFQLIQNGTTMLNEGPNGLPKLDRVMELAQDHGLYVLLSLTNNWNPMPGDPEQFIPSQAPGHTTNTTNLTRNFLSNSYGGMDTYVRNFGGPLDHGQFFKNQTLINAFLNYTNQIVARYANRTNVFSWEVANDPQCNSTIGNLVTCTTSDVTLWHNVTATNIKNMDPNHLVSSGNQGYFCNFMNSSCPKHFPPPMPPPAPQTSPSPGIRRRIPEPQSKAKLLKERKAAWKKERERQKRAGVHPDGVKIRGRWTASQTKRQSDLTSLSSAFDGSHGVDSQDILGIPQIGFNSFQFFPDQFNYQQSEPDPSLPAFNQTLQTALDWIRLHVATANLFNKPGLLTGFGLVTQDNSPFFIPFNSTVAPVGPDLTTSANTTQPFGVTDAQRDDAYKQIIQAALTSGFGAIQYQWSQENLTPQEGTVISTSPTINETSQSPVSTTVGQSPNDGYGILGQGQPDFLNTISQVTEGIGSDTT